MRCSQWSHKTDADVMRAMSPANMLVECNDERGRRIDETYA